MGCSTQSQPQVVGNDQTVSEPSSKQPETISEETQSETKTESSLANEPTTSTVNNKSADSKPSKSVDTNQPKAQVVQPSKTPQKPNGPQILGTTDPNASFGSGINFQAPSSYSAHPKKNLTVNWSGHAPNFLLGVQDVSITDMTNVFLAYVGNVNSYTIPGNLLTEGHNYKISLYATNGTDNRDPNYKQSYANNSSMGVYGRIIAIHTLTPPIVTFPQNTSELPKADVTVKWNKIQWIDSYSNQPMVRYEVDVRDLTDNSTISFENSPRGNYDSFVIGGSKLVAGHSYRVKVTAIMAPYDYGETAEADNKKSTTITFTVK